MYCALLWDTRTRTDLSIVCTIIMFTEPRVTLSCQYGFTVLLGNDFSLKHNDYS